MQFYYICRRDYSYFTELINKKQKKREKKSSKCFADSEKDRTFASANEKQSSLAPREWF